jgi:hypothetical protein
VRGFVTPSGNSTSPITVTAGRDYAVAVVGALPALRYIWTTTTPGASVGALSASGDSGTFTTDVGLRGALEITVVAVNAGGLRSAPARWSVSVYAAPTVKTITVTGTMSVGMLRSGQPYQASALATSGMTYSWSWTLPPASGVGVISAGTTTFDFVPSCRPPASCDGLLKLTETNPIGDTAITTLGLSVLP